MAQAIIVHLTLRAREEKTSQNYRAARNIMDQARLLWRHGIGIVKPDFSVEEEHEVVVDEARALENLARENKRSGYREEATKCIPRAQSLRSKNLGIEKPDFSVEEWHELAVDEVRALENLARKNKNLRSWKAAHECILEAQQLWSDGLGIKKPAFLAEEWYQLEVDSIQALEERA